MGKALSGELSCIGKVFLFLTTGPEEWYLMITLTIFSYVFLNTCCGFLLKKEVTPWGISFPLRFDALCDGFLMADMA